MELHKAIKEIVASKGTEMINNIQIINFLLDYQAFKEKPATKLILRDVINAGYDESILALQNTQGWQTKFKQYEHEFIDSCGYKEELAAYVFESIAYALGLNAGGDDEPAFKPSFNVDSFFDIPEVEVQQPANPQNTNRQTADPTDLYMIALSFYNEGKYQQAKGFIEKAINTQPNASIPSHHLRLLGDIYMKMGDYEEAIKCYNECFTQKAKEERCTIDQLRESLKQHKVKGYENMMFCYFFCLYAAKRINDVQWLQFVKSEARFGLMDAIRYCADNGINPVEDHIDIYFTDKDKVINGDYLYEDGTFAHENSKTKKAIAKIVIAETSEYEKSLGWTHGYIIRLAPFGVNTDSNLLFSNIPDFAWSSSRNDLPFPHSHYTLDDIKHWDEIEKVESEHFISISDSQLFPAFGAVERCNQRNPLPLSINSKWFLPSIHTIKRLGNNVIWMRTSASLRLWTSSQCDENHAISYDPHQVLLGTTSTILKNEGFYYENKYKNLPVYPVAAF